MPTTDKITITAGLAAPGHQYTTHDDGVVTAGLVVSQAGTQLRRVVTAQGVHADLPLDYPLIPHTDMALALALVKLEAERDQLEPALRELTGTQLFAITTQDPRAWVQTLATTIVREREQAEAKATSESQAPPAAVLALVARQDAEAEADRLLEAAAEQGDARPAPYMAGRNGAACTWADDSLEAALWRRGHAELQELIASGLVVPADGDVLRGACRECDRQIPLRPLEGDDEVPVVMAHTERADGGAYCPGSGQSPASSARTVAADEHDAKMLRDVEQHHAAVAAMAEAPPPAEAPADAQQPAAPPCRPGPGQPLGLQEGPPSTAEQAAAEVWAQHTSSAARVAAVKAVSSQERLDELRVADASPPLQAAVKRELDRQAAALQWVDDNVARAKQAHECHDGMIRGRLAHVAGLKRTTSRPGVLAYVKRLIAAIDSKRAAEVVEQEQRRRAARVQPGGDHSQITPLGQCSATTSSDADERAREAAAKAEAELDVYDTGWQEGGSVIMLQAAHGRQQWDRLVVAKVTAKALELEGGGYMARRTLAEWLRDGVVLWSAERLLLEVGDQVWPVQDLGTDVWHSLDPSRGFTVVEVNERADIVLLSSHVDGTNSNWPIAMLECWLAGGALEVVRAEVATQLQAERQERDDSAGPQAMLDDVALAKVEHTGAEACRSGTPRAVGEAIQTDEIREAWLAGYDSALLERLRDELVPGQYDVVASYLEAVLRQQGRDLRVTISDDTVVPDDDKLDPYPVVDVLIVDGIVDDLQLVADMLDDDVRVPGVAYRLRGHLCRLRLGADEGPVEYNLLRAITEADRVTQDSTSAVAAPGTDSVTDKAATSSDADEALRGRYYRAGRRAFADGYGVNEHPDGLDQIRLQAWTAGWQDAEADDEAQLDAKADDKARRAAEQSRLRDAAVEAGRAAYGDEVPLEQCDAEGWARACWRLGWALAEVEHRLATDTDLGDAVLLGGTAYRLGVPREQLLHVGGLRSALVEGWDLEYAAAHPDRELDAHDAEVLERYTRQQQVATLAAADLPRMAASAAADVEASAHAALLATKAELDDREAELEQRAAELDAREAEVNEHEAALLEHDKLQQWSRELEQQAARQLQADGQQRRRQAELDEREALLLGDQRDLHQRRDELERRERELEARQTSAAPRSEDNGTRAQGPGPAPQDVVRAAARGASSVQQRAQLLAGLQVYLSQWPVQALAAQALGLRVSITLDNEPPADVD